MRFSDHVREVRASFDVHPAAVGEAPASLVWLRDDERVAEAVRVDPLVDRFAELELLPGRPGVGRFAKHTHFAKTLGARYARRLTRMNEEEREGVCDAIRHTMAVGYFFVLDSHAVSGPMNVVEGRTPAAIWDFWVVRLMNDFLEAALSEEQLRAVQTFGTDAFAAASQQAGLRSRGPGSLGTRSLGWVYARGGAVLRIAQSDQVNSESFGRGAWDLVNPWPYDAVAGA